MPDLKIRSDAERYLRDVCGVSHTSRLDAHIGIHRSQISRVFAGKYVPGNRFVAGVVSVCGAGMAFDKVFEIVDEAAS